jgi:hypothetical protein
VAVFRLLREPNGPYCAEIGGLHVRGANQSVSEAVVVGWIIYFAGMALWLYGYLATGNPSLVDWHAITAWWIADFLPNIEYEIGMTILCAAMVPIYWPRRR